MTLYLTQGHISAMYNHGVAEFPHECCGALLANETDLDRLIEVRPLENVNKSNPKRRYELNPQELASLEIEAEERGMEIVGFYHSHPNHPAKPSEFDRDHAWPNWTYIIMSIMDGKPSEITAWTLNGKKAFEERELKIIEV